MDEILIYPLEAYDPMVQDSFPQIIRAVVDPPLDADADDPEGTSSMLLRSVMTPTVAKLLALEATSDRTEEADRVMKALQTLVGAFLARAAFDGEEE